MGIELNYRTSVHKKEIIDALIQIKIEATPVLIWQNENGIRKITKAKIDAIHFQNDSIVLIPYSENEKLMFMDFAENKTTYGEEQKVLFLSKIKKPSNLLKTIQYKFLFPTKLKCLKSAEKLDLIFQNSI